MDGAGTISGRWALAAGRAGLNGCRICSGPTLPGTRLCAQCKAALKRARQETVSELAPPLKRSATRANARPRTLAAAPVEPSRLRSARAWRNTAIGLVGIVVVAFGYTLLHLMRPPQPLASVAEPAPVPVAAPSPAIVRPDPAAGAQAREGPPVPAARREAKLATARLAAKRVTEAAPAPAQPPADRFPTVAELPPVPVPDPAPAPRPAAPARDRWQLMADEIAQCGRTGFFSGVICEQKLRLKYCEGYWGQAAQCPNGIPNDHGR